MPDGITPPLQKIYHRKSKFGCKRCRARRIKCDEVKPSCRNCTRHQVRCVYDRVKTSVSSDDDAASESTTVVGAPSASSSSTHGDAPESRERRLTELRLILHYASTTETSLRFDGTLSPEDVPVLSMKSDAFLYSSVSLAALHLSLTGDDPVQKSADMQLHLTYLHMAIREQRKELSQLSRENAETVTLSANKLRVCNVATLQYRQRTPYTPPMEFLRSGAVGEVYRQLGAMMAGGENTTLRKMLNSSRIIQDKEERYHPRHRRGFEHLLDRQIQDLVMEDLLDPEIIEAYETTLSYIGGIFAAVKAGELHGEIIRRLLIFPMMIQVRFINLVEAHQPRALVMLAHYFALLFSQGRGHWWIGPGGAEEMNAIAAELVGTPWHAMLQWPMEHIKHSSNYQWPCDPANLQSPG